ncbi:MAG: cytochrome-c peroxidase, partial [Gemmatimonadales bacterium]
DQSFHNTGVAWRDGMLVDSGRAAVTGAREALGAFKTPSLRNVARTAPYMHDGSVATLEEVVEFYDGGGNPNPYQDPDIRPLNLNASERSALLAFLRSLSGRVPTL